MKLKTKFGLFGCLILVGVTYTVAQANPASAAQIAEEHSPRVAQVVALDECDPTTFNQALGPDFCKNIALGYFTTLSELFMEAQSGHPDPKWDFEPDTVHIHHGTTLSVV